MMLFRWLLFRVTFCVFFRLFSRRLALIWLLVPSRSRCGGWAPVMMGRAAFLSHRLPRSEILCYMDLIGGKERVQISFSWEKQLIRNESVGVGKRAGPVDMYVEGNLSLCIRSFFPSHARRTFYRKWSTPRQKTAAEFDSARQRGRQMGFEPHSSLPLPMKELRLVPLGSNAHGGFLQAVVWHKSNIEADFSGNKARQLKTIVALLCELTLLNKLTHYHSMPFHQWHMWGLFWAWEPPLRKVRTSQRNEESMILPWKLKRCYDSPEPFDMDLARMSFNVSLMPKDWAPGSPFLYLWDITSETTRLPLM